MIRNIVIYLSLAVHLCSCGDFLDVKPRSELVVPKTLDDFQQLLNNGSIMHRHPEILGILGDDYYFEESYWNSLSDQVVRNAHVWASDIYGTEESHSSWSNGYQKVFYANVVLDGLGSIQRTQSNTVRYDQIKGQALFVRAEALYILAQLFAYPYNANEDFEFGLPIPVGSDINEQISRSTVHETYDFIINDLGQALDLVQEKVDFSKANKAAVYGLLARIYLVMGNYSMARYNATESLKIYDDITDLNQENLRSYKKSLYLSYLSPASYIVNYGTSTFIADDLYSLYDSDDLRVSGYYSSNAQNQLSKKDFRGLVGLCFSGLDTEEMVLIQAECLAREEATEDAISQLERLLMCRYRTGYYVRPNLIDATEALELILAERRKELVFAGMRWSDIRRLNEQGENISLERKIGNQVYHLAPGNRALWTMPIPMNEFVSSGIKQIKR